MRGFRRSSGRTVHYKVGQRRYMCGFLWVVGRRPISLSQRHNSGVQTKKTATGIPAGSVPVSVPACVKILDIRLPLFGLAAFPSAPTAAPACASVFFCLRHSRLAAFVSPFRLAFLKHHCLLTIALCHIGIIESTGKYHKLVFVFSYKTIYEPRMNKTAPQTSKIKEFREAIKLSQAAVANMANTSQSQIVKLEKDQRKITKAWATRLAPILGVHPARILFSDDELGDFRGIASIQPARPWQSALAEAIALSRRQGATPQCVHAELQQHLPLTTEQTIALLAQRPRIQQELALQVSERILRR